MSRGRLLWLLGVALLVISGALYLNSRRNEEPAPSRGKALLPTLANELDSVAELRVRKGGAAPSVTVHKKGDQWTVAERGDYPADVAKLRKLLVALGDAKIVEEKTSNPANFSIIGLEDPAKAGATGAEVTVVARDGSHAVIIGNPIGQGDFARLSGDNQSVIVEPAISVETEPRLWIDGRLLDMPAASIQSIAVKPAGGAGYVVRRLKPKEDNFELEGTPLGRKAADSRVLAPSPSLLSALTADDVANAGEIDFSRPTEAVLTWSDGKSISLIGSPSADKHWIQVKAGADAALEAKTKGRAFEIASYRYDAIFRPLEQLLVPKESKAAGKASAPGRGPKPTPEHQPAPAPGT